MKIVSREIDEHDVNDSKFEGCSEKPTGCGPCCDKSGEDVVAATPEAPVASLEDLLLVP